MVPVPHLHVIRSDEEHSQLFYHCPCRPWQVHSGRPHHPVVRWPETREMEAQVLDSNPIERERGITIKAQSVSLLYKAQDGQNYHLNLIDTPDTSISPTKSAAH